jgi:hypothetical protein
VCISASQRFTHMRYLATRQQICVQEQLPAHKSCHVEVIFVSIQGRQQEIRKLHEGVRMQSVNRMRRVSRISRVSRVSTISRVVELVGLVRLVG